METGKDSLGEEVIVRLSEYLDENSDRREKEIGDRVKIFDFSFTQTEDGKEFTLLDEGANDTFIVIEKKDNLPTSKKFWELKSKENNLPPELAALAIGKPNDLFITNGKIKLYIRSLQVYLPDFKRNEDQPMAKLAKEFLK